MKHTLTLFQFQSPFQGLRGHSVYNLDMDTGHMTRGKRPKSTKLLRKGQKKIDGLVLFPTWLTRKGLCLIEQDGALKLYKVDGNQIDLTAEPIDASHPNFTAQTSERLLYRTVHLSDGASELRFSDFENRLIDPPRTAHEIFPPNDFSPFSRLVTILNNPALRAKLVNDLGRNRFDYPFWIDRSNLRRDDRAGQMGLSA